MRVRGLEHRKQGLVDRPHRERCRSIALRLLCRPTCEPPVGDVLVRPLDGEVRQRAALGLAHPIVTGHREQRFSSALGERAIEPGLHAMLQLNGSAAQRDREENAVD